MSDVVTHAVGDDVVLERNGIAVALTGTAALMWRLLQDDGFQADGSAVVVGDGVADDAVTDLAAATGVDRSVIERRMAELLGQLAAHGLLDDPVTAAPGPTTDPIVVPEVGEPLPDESLTVIGAGRRALLVHWDASCAHCAEIEGRLAARRDALDHAGVTMRLVDGDDRATFRHTGTPTAFLLDASGRVERPMAAGTRELLDLVDELCGADEPRAAPLQGVEYPPAAPPLCVPGDPRPLTRSRWAGTRAYRLRGNHVGIRVSSEPTGEVLDRLLPGARVEDPRVPVHYSVELHLDEARDGVPGNVLARGGSEILRSQAPGRVLAALLAQLDDDLDCARAEGTPVAAAALVADGRAVVVPWATRHWSYEIDRATAARGLVFVDRPRPSVDLTTGELVVSPPGLSHDEQVIVGLDDAFAAVAEPPRVRPGRYPITAWCSFAVDGVTRPLTPAEAVAAALPSVQATAPVGTVIEELARAFARVSAYALTYANEREFVDLVATL